MKIKLTILALAVGLTVSSVRGQSIKDYFIPDSTHNKASFYTPDKTGGRTDMTRTIYYVKKGTTYDITDAKMFSGQPSAIQTITVQFSASEVKMTKSISTTMMETNKKQDYNPPITILKMPAAGQTVNWTFKEISGDNVNCISSWTTINYNGEQRKAIKVTKTYIGLSAKTIEYYVKGIGLWKTEISGEGKTQTFDKFDSLEYDPTAK